MKFVPQNLPKLERKDTPSGRRYVTPEGEEYPSVTTILSSIPNIHLEEWKKEVGDDVAKDISERASRKGSLIHDNVERYLKGEAESFNMFQQSEKDQFQNVIPILNEIEEVYCLEDHLWSNVLQVAGTVDCIAKYRGKIRIIDWKTSRRFKSREDISEYFMQTACYAYMYWERTGKVVKDLMIVIMTEDNGLLVFEEKLGDWLKKFIEVRNAFDK